MMAKGSQSVGGVVVARVMHAAGTAQCKPPPSSTSLCTCVEGGVGQHDAAQLPQRDGGAEHALRHHALHIQQQQLRRGAAGEAPKGSLRHSTMSHHERHSLALLEAYL